MSDSVCLLISSKLVRVRWMRSCKSLTRGSASACTSCAVWWKVHQPNTKPSSVSTSSNFLRSCTACSWNTYSNDAWQKSRSAMSIAASASWKTASGFLVESESVRSWLWQNLAVFLSNFFLPSLTAPMCSLRKRSSGWMICSCARPSMRSRSSSMVRMSVAKWCSERLMTRSSSVMDAPMHANSNCSMLVASACCAAPRRLAACTTSLTSLMSRLICWLVRSNSFSCLCRFSRNCGLSARHSVNSSGCRPTPIVTHSQSHSRSQHHALSPRAMRRQHRDRLSRTRHLSDGFTAIRLS